jgi:hypothetical protein
MTSKHYRKMKKLKSKIKMKNPIYQLMKNDKSFKDAVNKINKEGVAKGGGIYLFGMCSTTPKQWKKGKMKIDRLDY